MKKNLYSNWREDLREIVDIPSSKSEKKKPVNKVDDKENVNNEVQINPIMKEEFEELGGVLLEFVELDEADQISQLQTKRARIDMKIAQERKKESQKQSQSQSQDNADNMMNSYQPEGELVDEKMDLKTADMGDVVKDFYKSDAPQFRGKTKEERRKMAIAAKLTTERGGKKLGEQQEGDSKNQNEETEVIDERRREDKGKPRPAEPSPAFKAVSKMMGSTRLGVQPRGKKKVPGQKPPAAGEFGAPESPAQKIEKRRDAARRAQDNMSSRFD